ncbi:MAG: hypothetical protein SRB2_03689 [Desulfobacteraceae bacterium Eth-SRB2]|nr:MAG: hypothetical protein SRB2_03689 [Desulfobacteraceae bacterium Eth-SRB2]
MENIIKILSSFGWPHVSLIFALIFIFVFKKAIREFIGKIKSVGKEGLKTESSQTAEVEEKRKKAVEELMKFGDSNVTNELESFIFKDLKQRELDTDSDTVKVLIRHLAATQLALDFEQIYNIIFGSQIFLLRKLNEVAGTGLNIEIIKSHFEHVQGLFDEQLNNWTLEQYLSFLFGRTLITVKDNNYHITIKGVDFLIWLTKTAKSENRPF